MKYRGDKTMVYSKLMVGILVSITLVIFGITIGMKGSILEAGIMGVIALIIAVFFIQHTIRELKSVKKGLPVEDERSKKVMTYATGKAYLISIWWLLALSWASEGWIQFRDVSQAMGAGIIGMAIILGLCWLYFNRRGDIE